MKVIVAGGRDFKPNSNDIENLLNYIKKLNVTEIVSGGCSGADRFGELVARELGLNSTVFHAEWSKYGKSAGPKRNERMAMYADGCILFKGGKGTLSMKNIAIKHGLEVIEIG